jgi:hypothetical protein
MGLTVLTPGGFLQLRSAELDGSLICEPDPRGDLGKYYGRGGLLLKRCPALSTEED